ncbi:MAG: hypothetical protein RI967_262, partial [Planctomycetota bacterium]
MRVDRQTCSRCTRVPPERIGRDAGNGFFSRVALSMVFVTIPIAPLRGQWGATGSLAKSVSQDGGDGAGTEAPGSGARQDGEAGPKDDAPRSLDDLLGIPSSESKSAEAATDRSSDRRLEQTLEGANMQDLVVRAMDGMREAAKRLGQDRDAGLGTQRIQQDIVATLDRLLAEAQRQQQSSKGSSRSRSRQQQQSPGDEPSERNGQSGSSNAQSDASASGASTQPGTDESTGQRPADESVVTGGDLDESRVEWGRLPERVRELILQGRRDRVSTLYERITREYYRRLAEE